MTVPLRQQEWRRQKPGLSSPLGQLASRTIRDNVHHLVVPDMVRSPRSP